MNGGNAVGEKVAALGGAPVHAEAADGFPVAPASRTASVSVTGMSMEKASGRSSTWRAVVRGFNPGMMGTVMPAARQRSRKR